MFSHSSSASIAKEHVFSCVKLRNPFGGTLIVPGTLRAGDLALHVRNQHELSELAHASRFRQQASSFDNI